MRILNWNIHGAGGIGLARQNDIVEAIANLNVDVVLLQEVPLGSGFLERLFLHGYAISAPESHPIGLWENRKNNYAAAIASRLPMTESVPPEGLRFPRLFSVAKIGHREFASCHIPNASGFNSWARRLGFTPDIKVTHLDYALAWLRGSSNRILAGDFNEPDFFNDGLAVGFLPSRADDQIRQRGIIDGLLNSTQIDHLCGNLHQRSDEPSHWIGSKKHPARKVWFDHALSTDLSTSWRATYLHDLRIARKASGRGERYSDHSPLLISDD
jgi:endonuclease/exonuclease/phosphatase family metal-dependent hydrolase